MIFTDLQNSGLGRVGEYIEVPSINGLYFLNERDGMLYRRRTRAIFTANGWQKSERFCLVMPRKNGKGQQVIMSINGKPKSFNLAKLQAQILHK